MKKNKFFLGLATIAATAFAFTGCSSDELDNQTIQKSGNKINFTYGAAATRTVTDPQSGTSVSTGLNVGIFGVSSEGTTTMTNYANNKYVTAASNAINLATGSSDMTWPTTTSATASIYAYAPYQESWEVNTANSFSVQSDQTSDDNYLASDLLYASAASQAQGATVNLAFSHKLSKVSITIKKATGSNVILNGATVKIKNTQLTTSLNPSTGALGDASGDVTDITAATIASELEAGNESSTATACAVIVPQTLAAGTAFVEISTTDSKTLIGKLSEATTFASSNSYSMTISVGTVTEATTEVNISLGSTSLVQWTDNSIGLTAYTVGDYVLTDGTFMKASAYSSASTTEKDKIVGIIFSTTVSSSDSDEGYNAYAMGLKRMKQKFPTNASYASQMCTSAAGFSQIENFADAYNDLNGRTRTAQMLTTGETYYGTLGDNQSAFIANLSWYNRTVTNSSGWFLPSIGQLIQIFNNLGGLSIASDTYTISVSGVPFPATQDNSTWTTNWQAYGDLITNLNAKIDVVKNHVSITGSSEIFSVGNIVYASSTENGSTSESHYGKIWGITFKDSSNGNGWGLGKNISRTDNADLSVIPAVAVKLPAVSN